VLASPILATSRYCGTASTTAGTSIPTRIMVNRKPLPRKRYLAKPYPAIAETTADRIAPPPAYSAVLTSQVQNTPPSYEVSPLKLDTNEPDGRNGAMLPSSVLVLVVAISSQTIGSSV